MLWIPGAGCVIPSVARIIQVKKPSWNRTTDKAKETRINKDFLEN